VRSLLSLLVLMVAITGIAGASPPSPANSTTPGCITLVGTAGGVPAPEGQFQVVVKDLANNPVVGAVVSVDLLSCPDLHLCADQLDPNAVVDCVNKRVNKITDGSGSVFFTVLGGSNGAGNALTLLNGGRIYENGTLIGLPTVSTFDLDGQGGVGANDLSAWLTDFGSGQNFGRSDFDCSNGVGSNDLSLWLSAFASGTMTSSCAASCP